MTLTPEPPESTYYVLVWREANSRRLRTYVDSLGLPVSAPLGSINPAASTFASTPDELAHWLATPVTDETIAVAEDVARSELGWNPQRSDDLE